MFRSRVLVVLALATAATMIGLDWIFPTFMFYTPYPLPNKVSNLLRFKKTIEVSLSLILLSIVMFILLWKRSGKVEKQLACVALGVGIGFWFHRDLLYLLSH